MRNAKPCEVKIEDYLGDQVRSRGGYCLKLAPVSFVGLPDRMILLPGGRVGFLELKREGKEPTRVQHAWLDRLRALGFPAGWTANRVGVDAMLARMERR